MALDGKINSKDQRNIEQKILKSEGSWQIKFFKRLNYKNNKFWLI